MFNIFGCFLSGKCLKSWTISNCLKLLKFFNDYGPRAPQKGLSEDKSLKINTVSRNRLNVFKNYEISRKF